MFKIVILNFDIGGLTRPVEGGISGDDIPPKRPTARVKIRPIFALSIISRWKENDEPLLDKRHSGNSYVRIGLPVKLTQLENCDQQFFVT